MPFKGPVFVACNHVNAFIDPLVVGKYFKGKFWFVARGDAFKNKTAAWWLNKLHILPIHRKEDDSESTIKNEGAMRDITNKLILGNRIAIYPEGICIQERRLRKLRKGTARMAFAAEQEHNFNLNIQIICAGLNYNRPNQFGADIDVVYGKSFYIKEYQEQYTTDPNKAIIALTQRMQKELEELMIIVHDKQDDDLFNRADEVLTPLLLAKENINRTETEKVFLFRKKLAEQINEISSHKSENIIELREVYKKYYTLLKQHTIRDWVIREHTSFNALSIILSVLTFVIVSPLFVFGLIHHYLPYYFGHKLAKKLAKNIEFFSSVNYNTGMFLMLISYIIYTVVASNLLGFSIELAMYLLLLPISGIVTHIVSKWIKKTLGRIRFYSIKDKKEGKALIDLREQLIKTSLKSLGY